jgi:hypothetical protein
MADITDQGWPTSRRMPRSTIEAFNDADRACAVERFTPPTVSVFRVGLCLTAVVLVVAFGAALLP